MLKATDLTIGEIRETVGIGDQYQFSKYFKKLYGVPPSRYRKKLKKLFSVLHYRKLYFKYRKGTCPWKTQFGKCFYR